MMPSRMLLLLFSYLNSCLALGMLIVTDHCGKKFYIPEIQTDRLLVNYWLCHYTVDQQSFPGFGDGVGYALVDSSGNAFPDPVCYLHQSAPAVGPVIVGTLTPLTIMTPIKPLPYVSVIHQAPKKQTATGNPNSNTLCLDALAGHCHKRHCVYRHLPNQSQIDSVVLEQSKKEPTCTVCTNPVLHDKRSCPHLHPGDE